MSKIILALIVAGSVLAAGCSGGSPENPSAEKREPAPEYSFEQVNNRELGNGTIVIDLVITETEAKTAAEFYAIGQDLKEEFEFEADALYAETLGDASDVSMWVLLTDRAKETYPGENVVGQPEYRDGVAVYTGGDE